MEEKRKRGRPRVLTDEEREQRKEEQRKKHIEYTIAWNKSHPERIKTNNDKYNQKINSNFFSIAFKIPKIYKNFVKALAEEQGTFMSYLFIKAFEEKYNISLDATIDNNKAD